MKLKIKESNNTLTERLQKFGIVYTRDFDLSECNEIRTALNKADR